MILLLVVHTLRSNRNDLSKFFFSDLSQTQSPFGHSQYDLQILPGLYPNMVHFLSEYSTRSTCNFRFLIFHRFGLVAITKNYCILGCFFRNWKFVRTPMLVKIGIVSEWLQSLARFSYCIGTLQWAVINVVSPLIKIFISQLFLWN